MADFTIAWKKITIGFPKTKWYANDRAPKLEEIQKTTEYIGYTLYVHYNHQVCKHSWNFC